MRDQDVFSFVRAVRRTLPVGVCDCLAQLLNVDVAQRVDQRDGLLPAESTLAREWFKRRPKSRQRHLLGLAELARDKAAAAAAAPPPPSAAEADIAVASAQAAEAEAEDDIEPPAERRREEKMSDRGLLRSFKPVAEEQLPLEKEELDRQMQEAAGAGGERLGGLGARKEAWPARSSLAELHLGRLSRGTRSPGRSSPGTTGRTGSMAGRAHRIGRRARNIWPLLQSKVRRVETY